MNHPSIPATPPPDDLPSDDDADLAANAETGPAETVLPPKTSTTGPHQSPNTTGPHQSPS